MGYTMSDLEERSGAKARTIREYIRQGYVDPPRGHGPAAEYDEEQLLQVVAIVRLRRRRERWTVIAEKLGEWSLEDLRAFAKETDPPAAAAAPPPPFDEAEVLEGEPVAPRARLPRGGAASTGDLEASPASRRAELPPGPRWVLAQLLPGLVLMVRDDAPPLVRRAAAEIVERYGA